MQEIKTFVTNGGAGGERGSTRMRLVAYLLLIIVSVEVFLSLWSTRLIPDPEDTARDEFGTAKVEEGETNYDVEVAYPKQKFESPVDFRTVGDSRVFVGEQVGSIKVFSTDAPDEPAKDFLNIRTQVKFGGEQGLLSFAFHPKFKSNGQVFVHYSNLPNGDTSISRFTLKQDGSNVLDPSSELLILGLHQPYANHNGGQLAFGPDGYLYIGLGDGGSAGDPERNGRNLKTLLGKILRIDVDSSSPEKPYGIPSDNPFVSGEDGARPEIYAFGLRNPWRFSFDSETKQLWAADVGQDRWEEVDLIEKGKNYGWNTMEGKSCFLPRKNCKAAGLEMPVFDYGHNQGKSITGGFVYRGKAFPLLTGRYVYGDFLSGRIWSLLSVAGQSENALLVHSKLAISSFGVDAKGELVILSYGEGLIYRLKAKSPA